MGVGSCFELVKLCSKVSGFFIFMVLCVTGGVLVGYFPGVIIMMWVYRCFFLIS